MFDTIITAVVSFISSLEDSFKSLYNIARPKDLLNH